MNEVISFTGSGSVSSNRLCWKLKHKIFRTKKINQNKTIAKKIIMDLNQKKMQR